MVRQISGHETGSSLLRALRTDDKQHAGRWAPGSGWRRKAAEELDNSCNIRYYYSRSDPFQTSKPGGLCSRHAGHKPVRTRLGKAGHKAWGISMI